MNVVVNLLGQEQPDSRQTHMPCAVNPKALREMWMVSLVFERKLIVLGGVGCGRVFGRGDKENCTLRRLFQKNYLRRVQMAQVSKNYSSYEM